MPLIKSVKKENVSKNIATEMHAGKPQRQAVAIALDVARRAAKAAGGEVQTSRPKVADIHEGPINVPVPGRTDRLPVHVLSGAYVLPADIVSALGEHNTLAGNKVIEKMFVSKRAVGGRANVNAQPVKVLLAGGEYVLGPDVVEGVGGGDIKKGHEILDNFVKSFRKKHIAALKKLPGPAKD